VGVLARKKADAEGQRKMVDAWSGEGARFIVAKELANGSITSLLTKN
jgi:hypothetical protein